MRIKEKKMFCETHKCTNNKKNVSDNGFDKCCHAMIDDMQINHNKLINQMNKIHKLNSRNERLKIRQI